MAGRKLKTSESQEQQALIQWFRLKYPQHHMIAIPNGQWIAGEGKRRFALINKYKAEGLTPGVSDLFLCVPKNGQHGMWLEMKAQGKTASSLSPAQQQWGCDMINAGYAAVWASGFEEAKEIIEEYLKGV